ncbi:MAG: ubiquinone biosynthesis regulatory protein kinase UbiB, partial [Burkholderiales bacterium]|nr:ubiquinone biosynthesis regulatory protein kinase UbiB [Burkholderiales bacterium]
LHGALHRRAHPAPGAQALQALLAEQRRTNRLLQTLLWLALGFAAGRIVMRALLPALSSG